MAENPLMLSCNDLFCLQYLINRRATISLKKSENQNNHTSILHIAAEYAVEPVVFYLSRINNLQRLARATGTPDTVPELANGSGRPIDIAIYRSTVGVVRVLIEQFYSVVTSEQLDIAFNLNKFDVFQLLLESGALISVELKAKLVQILSSLDHPLKSILENRLIPFQLIRAGYLQQLKEWYEKELSQDINTYLDLDNYSLLYIAVSSQQYEIYGYLISVGARFRENEGGMKKLVSDETERLVFENAVTLYLTKDRQEDSLIASLVSWTHFRKLPGDSVTPYDFYRDMLLDPKGRPLTSIMAIVKVLEFAVPKPLIIIDMTSRHVGDIYIDGHNNLGIFNRPTHRVYVGFKTDYRDFLGTLIHELTHFACKVVFENIACPFFPNTPEERQMKQIRDSLSDRKQDHEFKYTDIKELSAFRGIFNSYSAEQLLRELIVRIPQTIVTYPESGAKALDQYTKELYHFYRVTFITQCIEYINSNNAEDSQLRQEKSEEKEKKAVSKPVARSSSMPSLASITGKSLSNVLFEESDENSSKYSNGQSIKKKESQEGSDEDVTDDSDNDAVPSLFD